MADFVPNTLSDVRRKNCKLIYDALKKSKGMTLQELEYSVGLSRPTTVNMVRALEEANLVIKAGKKNSNGGRIPILYKTNPEAYYVIGIDYEFPISRIAISDMNGNIKYRSIREDDSQMNVDQAIQNLVEQIKNLIDESGIEKEKFLGVGLGMPGFINLKTGHSVQFERVAGWKNIDITKILVDELEIPVFMENDVHLLYRAERKLQKRKGNQDVIFIAIRRGIGMAIYQRGHLIEGEYGNAGHIGHMTIHADGLQCRCGNFGCLELYASEDAIIKKYESLSGKKVENVTEIVEKAYDGDNVAMEVLREAGRVLGIGIGNVVNLFDIDMVIVSSCFDNEILLDNAQKELDRRINIPQSRHAKIYQSILDEDSFALGGGMLALRRNQQKIFENVQFMKERE